MTRLPLQATRFDRLQRRVAAGLAGGFRGTWRRRSLGLLALLLGLYAGNNLTAYWLQKLGQRPLVVLITVLLVELLVRLRTRLVKGQPALAWVMLDNLRIGVVYALVLEAFKLGS
jgi:hypothetical protein